MKGELALHGGWEDNLGEESLEYDKSTDQAGKLTKASLISILPSLVSGGAVTLKFLTNAATVILSIIKAKFIPPHWRLPVPNGIRYCAIFAVASDPWSHRSGMKLSGEGKMAGSRCIDQPCVAITVPGGKA